ncbi:putative cation efflux protein [Helianthus debilis subsp. tardiflorus]
MSSPQFFPDLRSLVKFGRKVFPQQLGFRDERIWTDEGFVGRGSDSVSAFVFSLLSVVRSGNRLMKRLVMLISLNIGCSTAELVIGLLSVQAGLVSDAFHLTFGCGLLTFSLFAMVASRRKPDRIYTYVYKRLEVLSAFTNSHFTRLYKTNLSTITNLSVNLIGIWFFRNYARVSFAYRNAED